MSGDANRPEHHQAARPGSRVAVVTGAGTGISAAVTRRLAADGDTVVLVGRRGRPLQDVAAQLGDRVLVMAADAASAADMAGVAEAARSRFGGIDPLVANAGGAGVRHGRRCCPPTPRGRGLRVNLTSCPGLGACLPARPDPAARAPSW